MSLDHFTHILQREIEPLAQKQLFLTRYMLCVEHSHLHSHKDPKHILIQTNNHFQNQRLEYGSNYNIIKKESNRTKHFSNHDGGQMFRTLKPMQPL